MPPPVLSIFSSLSFLPKDWRKCSYQIRVWYYLRYYRWPSRGIDCSKFAIISITCNQVFHTFPQFSRVLISTWCQYSWFVLSTFYVQFILSPCSFFTVKLVLNYKLSLIEPATLLFSLSHPSTHQPPTTHKSLTFKASTQPQLSCDKFTFRFTWKFI